MAMHAVGIYSSIFVILTLLKYSDSKLIFFIVHSAFLNICHIDTTPTFNIKVHHLVTNVQLLKCFLQ